MHIKGHHGQIKDFMLTGTCLVVCFRKVMEGQGGLEEYAILHSTKAIDK